MFVTRDAGWRETARVRRALAVVLSSAVVLAACGTRLPDAAFEPEAAPRSPAAAGAPAVRGSSPDRAAGTPADAATGRSGATTATSIAARADADEPGATGPNQASDVGITTSTVAIGVVVAENGVLGDAFAPAARGMRAWAASVNASGGIRGRKVVLKSCDDREDRNRNLACAQQLVERDKVFALVGNNTRAAGGSAQYLADRAIPVVGFPITNSYYRYPTFFGSYRHPYPRDGKTVGHKGNLVQPTGIYRWFKQQLGVSKAAVFSYDIDESKQAAAFFAKGLQAEGFQVTPYQVSFAAPSFDQAVADMQRRGTQIIFDTMDDGANRKLCDAMARRNFAVKAKVSTVVSMGDRVGEEYNTTCRRAVFVSGHSLAYTQTAVPAIAEFRRAYARYQPNLPLHEWALEAFMLGQMVGEYLDRPAPTRNGLVAYLNGLVDYRGNGVFAGLDWGKQNPAATRVADCFTLARWSEDTDGWVEATSPAPFCYPDAFQVSAPALEQGN